MTDSLTPAVKRYLELVTELWRQREIHGTLSDDQEEKFAAALNDCRSGMTEAEIEAIERVFAARPREE